MLVPGVKLGPYEVVASLGAGGMGEVYRAKDSKLHRDVAIKVLPESLAKDSDALARFEREARAVAALNHPNILSIFDFGSHEGMTYAVMELLEGVTLREKLEDGALTTRKAIETGLQIARGLAAAHGKGIVHRDLKPENVFILDDGRVKILDFGLAKTKSIEEADTNAPTAAFGTEPGTVMGTVGYMSPEQVRGKTVDQRTDIFSFGAVLYEMLTGRRAFAGDSAVETMNAILKADPPEFAGSRPDLSPALQSVVAHCLEKNRDERFESARDLAFALQAVSDRSFSSGSLAAISKPSRVGRSALVLAAGAALVAVAAFLAGRSGHAGLPQFQRLTYLRGTVQIARFSADGHSVFYGAKWDGRPVEAYSVKPGQPESTPLGFANASVLAVSRSDELALQLRSRLWNGSLRGMLARAPVAGGAPREVLDNVMDADWTPDGRLAVLKGGADFASQIELPPGTVIYRTDQQVGNVRVSPDGRWIAFLESEPKGAALSVCVVDVAGRKRVLVRDLAATGPAWSRDGTELWYSESPTGESTSIRAVTLSGHDRAVYRLAGRFGVHDRAADGTLLVEDQVSTNSVMFQGKGESRERDLAWLAASGAMDLTPDGGTLLLEQFDSSPAGGSFSLRRTDGTPAVRLGDGLGWMFSPDGKWVVVTSGNDPEHFTLTPTGAGAPRAVSLGAKARAWTARFLPDGRRLLANFKLQGEDLRYFLIDIATGKVSPATPPGYSAYMGEMPISPDGSRFTASKGEPGSLVEMVFPIAGGEPRPLPGFEQDDIVIGWSGDGRSVYTYHRNQIPIPVYKIDVETGRRTLWRSLSPPDSAGVSGSFGVDITPDGQAYAYNFNRILSTLYLIKGLR